MQSSRQSLSAAQSRRSGFTLIELLVVMAIIALLASLLFPAIQRVREGGRRTACLSQLHNLAIAAHNYHAVYKTIPSGWITDNNPPCNIQLQVPQPIQVKITNNQTVNLTDYSISQEWGWHAMLLPQIEESNLLPDWNVAKLSQAMPQGGGNPGAPAATQNWQRIQFPIEIYVCPSAVMPNSRPNGLGYTTYRGNYGYWPVTQQTPLDNGTFYANSRVDLDRDIQDGTSHTIMFGESLLGFWGDANSCCARFRDDFATPNYFDQYWNRQDACGTNVHFFGWGSYHGEVANFVFADGHEASIPKNTDRIVLQAIATRNGGEPQRLNQ